MSQPPVENIKCFEADDGGYDYSTSTGGILYGDWEFCTNSNQCRNQCCSNKYSTSDGRLKCTPVGGFKPWEGCLGAPAPAPAPSNSNSVSAGVMTDRDVSWLKEHNDRRQL